MGFPIAVIEAKNWDKPLTEGVAQAKNCAGKMALRFAYATNGMGICGIDMETGKEGELPSYLAGIPLHCDGYGRQNSEVVFTLGAVAMPHCF